ncbi:glycoside hydrolase family 32 protein [Humibacter sp. RRB41]|uniref:glycoside hydrolase family 32 protein n=1 Tax=Humibacter sp. RRB41 TaxID=2919946 RepID=UPI001FAB1F2C|nr:glycoside hydrolase family 32 protein [Humibacter sp. RRB41]
MAEQHPHHRPKFHISPARGYLNDPNGPIELGDVFHLYYQSRSFPDLAVPVEWGHATTTDLVHWTLHRPAMGPVPGGLDSDGCWSGNSVVEGDRVRAYYSGHVRSRRFEHILTALSDENGTNFGAPARLLDDPDAADGIRMLRDPFVWTDADGRHMAIGSVADGGVAAIRHYRSDDGLKWRYEGHLAELPRTVVDGVDTGEGWECPQIIRVGDREVAVVCSWSFEDGPGSVVAFPLDRTPEPRVVDDGHDFYAPSVVRRSSHGPLLFGWIMEGRDAAWWQEEGWSGAISLPRRVWIDADSVGTERLCTEPHPALDRLRTGEPRHANGAVLEPQSELVIPAVAGTVRLWFGMNEWVDVDLDPEAGTVAVDTNHASVDVRARGGRVVAFGAFEAASARPAVRVFIDGSVIEVFTSSGRSLTTRAYPLSGTGWRVEAPHGALVWSLAEAVRPEGRLGDVALETAGTPLR